MRTWIGVVTTCGLALLTLGSTPELLAAEGKAPNPWEQSIAAFEKQDAANPPPKGEIVLAGSSSARGWNVKKYFPDLKVVNRGFGGSQIADSTEFADRIIIPLQPRILMLYAGDNDIASGKSPEQVFEAFKAFVAKIHGALPKTRIVFICIKPSLSRWRLVEKMRAANRLVEALTKTDDRLQYADVDAPMIGADGKPRPELLVKDGLHLSPAGYELWTSILLPFLKAEAPQPEKAAN